MSEINTPSNPSKYLPLKLSKKDFNQYKEKLEKFLSIKKEEYKNLFESFDILKQKKFHLSFLLFSYYNSWVFPYISYNKITRGNIFSSTFEISFIFKKLSKNMNCPFDEKLFILWYFYIYYNFFIKEKKDKPKALINQMRYLLLETGKIVINLFEKKYLSINSVVNILDVNLLCLEYFIESPEFVNLQKKFQKTTKLIFFLNFFHLLKEISVLTLKQKEGFDSILAYLDKICLNSELKDEINITMLFNNNILQNFMESLLENINVFELKQIVPNYKEKLIDFYSHFLFNKYKASNLFNFLVDTLRNSFEHLYNFKQNKNLIIKDIFKNNFNSNLLSKLHNNKNLESTSHQNIDDLNQLNSSYYFDSKRSNISFQNTKKISLDQVILFFSFKFDDTDSSELPLFLILNTNKKKEKITALKIFLKKELNDEYKLYVSQQKNDKINILNEQSDLVAYKNQNYFCGIYLNDKKMNIYLYSVKIHKMGETTKSEIVFNPIPKDENMLFYLGKDEKDNNFYRGKIGPFIIIKAPKLDNKANKDIEKFIGEVLCLCENYKDFIIKKSELSKTYDLILKDFFWQKYFEDAKKMDKIKGNFECLLYLNPDNFKFYKNLMLYDESTFNSENKNIPLFYEFGNQNLDFVITNFNVTIHYEEMFIKLFMTDNGIYYFCLLFEYYNQFLRYYLLKNEKQKEKIFDENEIKDIMKDIIESIIKYILMLGNQSYSKYAYNSSKKIWNYIYSCILNLNKISPIINEFIHALIFSKDLNRDVLLTCKNRLGKHEKDSAANDSKNKIEREKNNNFIDFNKSNFIGINEILLTPEFYKNDKDIIKLNDIVFNSVFKGINDVADLLDLPLIENIFYKLLNFILVLKDYYANGKKEENEIIINEEKKEIKDDDKFKQIFEKIFRLIIEFLNRKTDVDNISLSKEFFNKLFMFVFECNKKDYNIIFSYLNVINETSKANKNIKLNGNQILQLKYFLSDSGKDKGKNEEDIIYTKKKQKIQNLIICKIYEYLFSADNNNDIIPMNFLDEYLQKNKLTKDLFDHIEKLLEINFVGFFKDENNDVNKPDSPLTLNELKNLNIYYQNIFEFLKYLLKLLRKKDLIEDNDSEKYLSIIYDIIFKSQNSIKIEAENNVQKNIKYIVYLLNFIEFIHSSLYNNELNFLFQESKILEIIEELFDKCNQLTMIHCEFYFKLKDEENSSEENPENKLISEIFIDIYKSRLQKIYDEYRLPGNSDKEVDKNDLEFINKFNSLLDKKFISEFNLETYDIKKSSNLQKNKSIFFDSDFLKLTLGKKYYKKFTKVKDISPKMKLYNLMNGIITLLKPDFIDFNNKFEFYHTTYHFYEAYDLCNIMVQSYSNDEEIKKHEDLKKSLEETDSVLNKFKNLLLDDHLKLYTIYKDFFTKNGQTNESKLKNMLKSIQNILFNKKYKNIEPNALINIIETEFSKYESKSEKVISSNSKGSNNSNGSNPSQKNIIASGSKDSFEANQSKNLEYLFPPEIFGDVSKFIINDNNINEKDFENDIENESFEQIEIIDKEETQSSVLVKSIINSPNKNILDKLDKHSILNPKKELMKTIFGTYFSKSFFENESFKKLKTKFLNTYNASNPDTKLLNYPSKTKNFINGLHPALFLKENNKFFISKIFPITHPYFYEYMRKNNLLNDSIILLKPALSLDNNINSEINKFNCELIKQDRIYYGQIKFWNNEKFFYFTREDFVIFSDKKEISTTINELNERGFSYSSLKYLETEGAKKACLNATNDFLDQDIFPKMDFNFDKKVIVFYDDIEEIIERRILFIWQGFEIFLKNGKSYMFNMLTKKNYEDFIQILKENNKNILFREKEFMQNTQSISQIWKDKKLDTYEYLLYLNKYSSRSFNDMSQYYIFPWILRDFSHLVEINTKEKELYEYKVKHDKDKDTEDESEDNNNNQKTKKKDNKEIIELLKKFRDLKYPVSAQEKNHRNTKREKFNDEEEKFQAHHGTHYATGSYVEYYLMRIEPFTSLLVELQNYSQEDPNRLLLRLKDTINIINTGYDNRELIPEMYSKIDFFININCVFFGFKKSSELVDDIANMWEIKNLKKCNMATIYSEFILAHRKLLNSNIISSKINIWIDNVFGYMQIPPAKKIEDSINIFPKSSYEKYVDLHKKLEKLLTKYEGKSDKILRKFINKINVITSFGQCPYQIFTEKHKSRESPKENEAKLEEDIEVNNYGMQDTYLGKDFIDTYIIEELKNDNTALTINHSGIYFEVNPLIDKIFILNESNKLTIIDTNFYCLSDPKKYNWAIFNEIELSSICLFNKIQTPKNNNYYIYNIKYAFSSFPSDINNSSLNLYANEYLNSLQYNYENKYERIKFITCRHLDNSFKIHYTTLKKKKKPEILEYSFICEDFVMCCKTFSDKSFIIGLRNGKLIKAMLTESEMYVDKNNKKHVKKYNVIFENYITGHLGSINVIEVDKKNGIVITGGDDNKIFIRKLYDFELLTTIEIKEKYIITMIKISPTNLLYVMCFNRILRKFVIFGYSLSGLKFAKSDYSFYKNIGFTKGGNIISLIDDSEIKILYGHNLKEIEINENDKDYKKFNNVKKSFNSGAAIIGWMQFDDFKNYYGFDRSVVTYISKEPNKRDYTYTFQTLKVTNISYFE